MTAVRPSSLFGAAATTYATNVVVSVLSLANVLVVARTLGPSGRGAVALLIAIATLSGQAGSLGVEEANANIGGAEPRLRPTLATNSLILAATLGVATSGLVGGIVALAPSVGGGVRTALLDVALASIPLVIAKQYLNLLVQSEYRFRTTNFAWISGPATTAAVNSTAAALGVLTVEVAIGAWMFGQALGLAILLVSVARGAGFGRPDARVGRRALGFGLKTYVGRLMDLGNYHADQWLLGAISGTRALGLYSVAVAWAESLYYLPGVLVLVQRPDLVRERAREAARRAARVFRVSLLLAALPAVVLGLAAPFLCTVVFGSRFAGSVPQLQVLALSAFGIVALQLLGNALTAQRMPLRKAAAAGVGFAVTLGVDIALIPRFGGLGAAIGTSAAWSVGGIVICVLFVRSLKVRYSDLVPRRSDLAWMTSKFRALAHGVS